MNDDALAKALEGVTTRLDRIESRLSKVDVLIDSAPGAVAAIADTIDDMAQGVADDGASLQERGREATALVHRVTRPEALHALSSLVDRLESLEEAGKVADQLPGAAAAVADTVDDLAMRLTRSGLDLPLASRRLAELLEFALWTLQSDEFAEILETGALRKAAGAWSQTVHEETETRGMFSLWRASRDPDVKRALDFAMRFTKRVGHLIDPNRDASQEEN